MNIGIILPHISPSQIRDEVFDIVNGQYKKGKHSYTIFFENVSPNYRSVIAPLMNISDARFFKGRLVSFSLGATHLALSLPNPIESILYSYDLEWLRSKNTFDHNVSIYRNPDLKLVTRSEDYAFYLRNYANKEVEVKSLESVLCPNEI